MKTKTPLILWAISCFAFASAGASGPLAFQLPGLSLRNAWSANSMNMAAMPFDKVVGDTKDGCDKGNLVKVQAKDGQKSIPHSTSNYPVEFPGMITEFHFYCGGTRERAANDDPFNKVLITRASNGALHIVFVVATPPPAGGSSAGSSGGSSGSSNPDSSWVHVGDTNDGCDKSHDVKSSETNPHLFVAAGNSTIVEMPTLTREIHYTCGYDAGRAANDKEFNRVQVERAGNGAIHFTFFRTPTASGVSLPLPGASTGSGSVPETPLNPSDDLGFFLHNARGNMIIQAPQAPKPIPSIALKQSLDKDWDDNRAAATAQLKAVVAQQGYGQAQINLATSAQSELRLAHSSDLLKFKYVVHGSTAQLSMDGGTANITFDAEAVLTLPRTQTLDKLKAGNVMAFVRHVEIEGGDVIGTIGVGLLKSRARAIETKIGNFSEDAPQLAKNANDMIDQLRQSVPVPANLVTVLMGPSRLGNVDVCAFVGQNVCQPVRGEIGAVPEPHGVGDSHDGCGEGKIWFWDYELGRYVPISKGQGNIVVQVDNKRFEWYCGDDNAPDPRESHQESASGPTGTYAVRVSRDQDRGISLQFLSWH